MYEQSLTLALFIVLVLALSLCSSVFLDEKDII